MAMAIGDRGCCNAAARKRAKPRADQAVLGAASGRRTTRSPAGYCHAQ